MSRYLRTSWLEILVLVTLGTPLAGQDQFGLSVAVSGSNVMVLKAFAGRGPPAVYVFAQDASGTWHVTQRLSAPRAAATGEGLSPSIAANAGRLLVGAGDPEARVGAHVFVRNQDGAWIDAPPVQLDASESPDSGRVRMSLRTVMRILQPPRRLVASDGDQALVALPGGDAHVRILESQGDGDGWLLSARLASDSTNDGFASALAVEGDIVAVGAPRHGASGAVFVYGRDPESREWSETARLQPEGRMPRGFGSAVLVNNGTVWVGAPNADGSRGAVTAFAPDPVSGSWAERARLLPGDTVGTARFGSALAALDEELWVGAPGAHEGRGLVFRFERSGEAWRAGGTTAMAGLEPRYGFGSSIGLGDQVAVVGVPGADGRRGRAAVFRRRAGGWSAGDWLRSGEDLEMLSGVEVPCTDGKAGPFRCNSVDLLSFLPTESLGGDPGESVSDIWGWTDPETSREYALIGRSGGAAFVDISDPSRPQYLGMVPANRSGARDLKVFQNHLFFTGDGAGAHGLLVFDLTRLRGVLTPPMTFEADARYDGIASAHNLVIDTEGGFAFPVGASGGGETCGGGLHMVDIRDPVNPMFAGCYTDTEGLLYPGRTHDAQCVVYRGPDVRYHGRQICFASNETALRIVDVTDKKNPLPIAAATYPGIAYVHQGWLTDDQRYFYLDDELDELVGLADRTRTMVWDVAELDDPVLVGEYRGSTSATDHNLFIKGDRMYQANYQAGLSVVDISDPERPVEVGFFDTTPYDGNPPGFNGAWTAYPFFESGTVIVSSMNEGLFVLRPRPQQLVP